MKSRMPADKVAQLHLPDLRLEPGFLRVLLRIPIDAGHPFRRDAGHRSDLKPAGIPISFRPPS